MVRVKLILACDVVFVCIQLAPSAALIYPCCTSTSVFTSSLKSAYVQYSFLYMRDKKADYLYEDPSSKDSFSLSSWRLFYFIILSSFARQCLLNTTNQTIPSTSSKQYDRISPKRKRKDARIKTESYLEHQKKNTQLPNQIRRQGPILCCCWLASSLINRLLF